MKQKAQWPGRVTKVFMTQLTNGKYAPVLQLTATEQERIVYAVLDPLTADRTADQLRILAEQARRANS